MLHKFCFISRSQLYLYFSGKQDQKIEMTRAMTNEKKKRIKKDSYLIWLEFFSLWFVNVLADVGAPKSVKIRRSDYFFLFFCLFIFRMIFCWQFFLLSPLPSCPLAPTLLLQVHSESAIRAAAWVRAASQSSSVFDRQTKEECFAQCSPTARHYGRILCSIVKKINIYYFEKF